MVTSHMPSRKHSQGAPDPEKSVPAQSCTHAEKRTRVSQKQIYRQLLQSIIFGMREN